jgi:hypothetical protein
VGENICHYTSDKRLITRIYRELKKLNYGNNQDASLLMNGLRKCGIYIQWNFTQP